MSDGLLQNTKCCHHKHDWRWPTWLENVHHKRRGHDFLWKKKKSFGPHKHGWKCPPALLMEKSCHGWRCPEVSIKTPGSVCHSSSRWQRPNFPWKVLWSCPTQLEIVTSYPWKYPVVPQCESQVLNNNRCLLPMYASTCYRLRTV